MLSGQRHKLKGNNKRAKFQVTETNMRIDAGLNRVRLFMNLPNKIVVREIETKWSPDKAIQTRNQDIR